MSDDSKVCEILDTLLREWQLESLGMNKVYNAASLTLITTQKILDGIVSWFGARPTNRPPGKIRKVGYLHNIFLVLSTTE